MRSPERPVILLKFTHYEGSTHLASAVALAAETLILPTWDSDLRTALGRRDFGWLPPAEH